mmetsp:Transcript_10785/g.23215  ORF Transcript_10785/g.23215 Transcript_10785/m.23215 type:complete len:117 (-) Transcript_10785:552-902(-)
MLGMRLVRYIDLTSQEFAREEDNHSGSYGELQEKKKLDADDDSRTESSSGHTHKGEELVARTNAKKCRHVSQDVNRRCEVHMRPTQWPGNHRNEHPVQKKQHSAQLLHVKTVHDQS